MGLSLPLKFTLLSLLLGQLLLELGDRIFSPARVSIRSELLSVKLNRTLESLLQLSRRQLGSSFSFLLHWSQKDCVKIFENRGSTNGNRSCHLIYLELFIWWCGLCHCSLFCRSFLNSRCGRSSPVLFKDGYEVGVDIIDLVVNAHAEFFRL